MEQAWLQWESGRKRAAVSGAKGLLEAMENEGEWGYGANLITKAGVMSIAGSWIAGAPPPPAVGPPLGGASPTGQFRLPRYSNRISYAEILYNILVFVPVDAESAL